jgi:DNA-binding Lrp family transcriptional regulator
MKMVRKEQNCSVLCGDELLDAMIIDPKQSLASLARKLGRGKTSVWRQKQQLEDNNTIFGYTTVVDETKVGCELFILLIKFKRITKESVDKAMSDLKNPFANKMGIRVINSYFTIGEYDMVIVFAANDNIAAKKYFDVIRERYSDDFEERPKLLDISFTSRREGIINPDLTPLKNIFHATSI